MDTIKSKLTVLFEDPFWIALYERSVPCKYEVCKITFGAEPRDYEIYDFMNKHQYTIRFSPPVADSALCERRPNPKRMQRQINKSLQTAGIGTKAQNALKLQQEQSKTERKIRTRQMREEEKQRIFELREQKRKKKHKGH